MSVILIISGTRRITRRRQTERSAFTSLCQQAGLINRKDRQRNLRNDGAPQITGPDVADTGVLGFESGGFRCKYIPT